MRPALAFVLGVCGLGLTGVAWSGQQSRPIDVSSTTVDEVLQAVRSDLQQTRKDIVAKNLTLTPDQSAKFWPLFEAYQKEQDAVLDEQLAGIQRYIETADTLDDAGALALMKTHLERDAKMVALRQQWLPRFQGVVGARLAVRMMQIDRRLSLVQQTRLVTKIPLAH
jgi:hypothetical protein